MKAHQVCSVFVVLAIIFRDFGRKEKAKHVMQYVTSVFQIVNFQAADDRNATI